MLPKTSSSWRSSSRSRHGVDSRPDPQGSPEPAPTSQFHSHITWRVERWGSLGCQG